MREALEQLCALQDISQQIETLRRNMEMLAVDVRKQERLVEEKKSRLAQTHQKRLDAIKLADATQLKVEQAEAEIGRFEVQLNVTKHQKDYDAIQHSILSHRADISKWEDRELATLEAADQLAQEEVRSREEIELAERGLRETQANVDRETADYKRRMQHSQDELDGIRSRIDPVVLSAYNRLESRNRRDVVVEIRGRVCQGCHTQTTKQTENRLMKNSEIVYCHSCGRILLLAE